MKAYWVHSGWRGDLVRRQETVVLVAVGFVPVATVLAIGLHYKTGNETWFLLPLFINYVLAPIIDWLIGEDTNNPPEEVVMQLDQDLYYRRLTYAVVPLHFVSLWRYLVRDNDAIELVGVSAAGHHCRTCCRTCHQHGA